MGENKFDGLSFFENNEFQNMNFIRGSMDNNRNEEEKGLIQKAIDLSKKGAETLQKGLKETLGKNNMNDGASMVSNSTTAESGSMFSNFPLFNNNNQNRENETSSFFAFTTLVSYKNFPLFCILFGISVLFMILSFFTLPMIVITPRQFGFFFTVSSICFVSSLAFLKGFSNLYHHLMEKQRLPFTTAYILSLVSTLYFTLINPLYLLALITSVIQMLALISFLVEQEPSKCLLMLFILMLKIYLEEAILQIYPFNVKNMKTYIIFDIFY
ncbi:protein transport protein SFT2, putative [Plasmodium reichenowi]|uniref:Vesicle transport protein n=1 Tax=Plasmodium reichenowi TaxID=5854 RepID=A0A151L6R9_PLARE|nr:protein transport protein SFT2, putative [Plasmodium reichenowi]KYN94660.1 protein transport protein SFT2, putative [Plasmodium reichenowi]